MWHSPLPSFSCFCRVRAADLRCLKRCSQRFWIGSCQVKFLVDFWPIWVIDAVFFLYSCLIIVHSGCLDTDNKLLADVVNESRPVPCTLDRSKRITLSRPSFFCV